MDSLKKKKIIVYSILAVLFVIGVGIIIYISTLQTDEVNRLMELFRTTFDIEYYYEARRLSFLVIYQLFLLSIVFINAKWWIDVLFIRQLRDKKVVIGYSLLTFLSVLLVVAGILTSNVRHIIQYGNLYFILLFNALILIEPALAKKLTKENKEENIEEE